MTHRAAPSLWERLSRLPAATQNLARANFDLLKSDPRHPSLRFKRIGRYWSVRVGRGCRALGLEGPDALVWFWIGTHAEYDELIRNA